MGKRGDEFSTLIKVKVMASWMGGGGTLPVYGIVQMCVPNGSIFQRCQVYD